MPRDRARRPATEPSPAARYSRRTGRRGRRHQHQYESRGQHGGVTGRRVTRSHSTGFAGKFCRDPRAPPGYHASVTPAEVAWTLIARARDTTRRRPNWPAASSVTAPLRPTRSRARAPCCSSRAASTMRPPRCTRPPSTEPRRSCSPTSTRRAPCARAAVGAARAALRGTSPRARPAAHRHAVAGRDRRAPMLSWHAARRAGLRGAGRRFAARGVWRRSPKRACRAVGCLDRGSDHAAAVESARQAPRRIREREDRDLREGGAGSDRRQAARPGTTASSARARTR